MARGRDDKDGAKPRRRGWCVAETAKVVRGLDDKNGVEEVRARQGQVDDGTGDGHALKRSLAKTSKKGCSKAMRGVPLGQAVCSASRYAGRLGPRVFERNRMRQSCDVCCCSSVGFLGSVVVVLSVVQVHLALERWRRLHLGVTSSHRR